MITKIAFVKKILISFFFLSLAFSITYAQNTNSDEQLALQYFQNKEFDKALIYYEKLFDKKNGVVYYQNYLTCLLEMQEYKKAEKVVKRMIKQNELLAEYGVDLGVVYKTAGEEKKAKEQFEKLIKELNPIHEQIVALAKEFMALKEWDYALETYRKAQRLLGNTYPFNFERAEVYAAKGDVLSMINEYLDILEINDAYIQSVQNALQTSFGKEGDLKKNEILKNQLVKRIQNSNDKVVFSELLIWMQLQQKDFEGAFLQAKALDKRKKEDGSRIMNLAQICMTNQKYEVAIEAYQYVILKGAQNYNYINAKIELLNTKYKKLLEVNRYKKEDLLELWKNYESTLAELGKYTSTIPLIKSYAHLLAFYLDKTETAIVLLEEAVKTPQLNASMQAECKLELGDVLLMSGDVWEASLIYSQVEKAFKYEPIGQEAKFRNAKIAYYTGDFKWAQAQADVLKGATSKLISNDAMDLSLLISDNLAIDTNIFPLLLFANADLLLFQNKYEQALVKLDSIAQLFPSHALADDVLFKKGEIAIKRSNDTLAIKYLGDIVSLYGSDILADDATYLLAQLYEQKLNNNSKAMELYQELMMKYPGSLYTVEARKRYRALRGDAIN